MKKIVNFLLRLVLVGGCLVYAFWGQNFEELWRTFLRFDPIAIAATMAFSMLSYFAAGLRLNYLTGFEAGNMLCTHAFMLSMGVNNIAPAKLGEVSKALYLRAKCNYRLAKTLSIVFWERFFDLNALLLMGCAVALIFKVRYAFVPLGAGVGAIWGTLFFLKYHPEKAQWVIDKIPSGRLHNGLSQIREQLVHGVTLKFFFVLGLFTVLCWLLYAGTTVLAITWIGRIGLPLDKVLAVFVISSVGMAMPSSPGAVGVYEAAMVFAMSTLFKVDKEASLAVALMLHFIQYVPTTVWGVAVLAKSGLSLKKIQTSDEQNGE